MADSRDIFFECPSCHKSMVIDEAAAGIPIQCPGCGAGVIVPPKTPQSSAPAKTETPVAPVASPVSSIDIAAFESRLSALGNKLKELQTQRTEISNNIGVRLNDINRQMVLLARLETSQQQVLQEWQQLVSQLKAGSPKGHLKA